MQETADGLAAFGRTVRWLGKGIAVLFLVLGIFGGNFLIALMFAIAAYIIGSLIGWGVQIIADRHRAR